MEAVVVAAAAAPPPLRAPASTTARRRCIRCRSRARCGVIGDGQVINAAALQVVNAAAVARPLGFTAAAESAAASTATAAARCCIGGRRVQPLHSGAVLIDGVHRGTTGSGRIVSRATAGAEQIGPAVGRGHHVVDRTRHVSHLLNAPVQAVPYDLHLHVGRRGPGATAASSCRLLRGCLRLRFGVDVAIVRVLLIGRQRHAVELERGAIQRRHRRGAVTAQEHQFAAIRRPARALRDQELIAADHVLLPGRQLFQPHVRTQLLILLAIRQPLAIQRKLGILDVARFARGHHFFFAGLHIHAAQFVVRAGPEQALRIQRPREARFVTVRIAQLLSLFAQLV